MPNTTDHDTNAHDTTTRLRDGLDTARETVSNAYHTGVDKASDAVHGLESSPVGILVGGLAVGLIAGALLPRSQREKELLAPVGQRISDTARSAVQAAREAGQAELETRGLTKDGAREQVRGLVEGVVQAVSTAGAAAAKGAKQNADG
ncbi:hypothetical protein [Sphingomonas sp. R86521]|uniref:hypothetical protein n=1 Tax=Sphingomonas sp. R86521 TaxID=3093860 RepID=UPI0036D23F12